MGEDLLRYSNKIESTDNVRMITNWLTKRIQAISQHLWEFYPQDGGENQLAQIWIEITSLSPYVFSSQLAVDY